MNDVIERVREELRRNQDPETLASGSRYFKEHVSLYGVKTARVTSIARAFLKEVAPEGKEHVFALCESLWQSGYMEECFIACEWSYSFRSQYVPEDFPVFERWTSLYVTNWAACDPLCNHTVGSFVEAFPAFIDNLKTWAHSKNRWLRRAAAVSLIIPVRKGRFHNDAFDIADALLLDADDLVQKGYGWLLKAASESDRQAVFDFVMQRKAVMPRTALRYAIEKMPQDMRARAMAR